MQALGELAVLYPVNGAFFTYIVRFVDPSWGFAVGWDYAIGWLTVLPFELTAASITIEFWRDDIHVSVWITIFLVFLIAVQFFGVRGYGEVEFVLSMIKIVACMGFIIFGIVVNCGGVPSDDRGYIGFRYCMLVCAISSACTDNFQGRTQVLSTTASTVSAQSLSLQPLLSEALSSLALQLLRPQTLKNPYPKQQDKCSGVSPSSTSFRSLSSESSFPPTTLIC